MRGDQPCFEFGKSRFIPVNEGWPLSWKYSWFSSVPLLKDWAITCPSRGLCYVSNSSVLEITQKKKTLQRNTRS